jgi:hypothetical protein
MFKARTAYTKRESTRARVKLNALHYPPPRTF